MKYKVFRRKGFKMTKVRGYTMFFQHEEDVYEGYRDKPIAKSKVAHGNGQLGNSGFLVLYAVENGEPANKYWQNFWKEVKEANSPLGKKFADLAKLLIIKRQEEWYLIEATPYSYPYNSMGDALQYQKTFGERYYFFSKEIKEEIKEGDEYDLGHGVVFRTLPKKT